MTVAVCEPTSASRFVVLGFAGSRPRTRRRATGAGTPAKTRTTDRPQQPVDATARPSAAPQTGAPTWRRAAPRRAEAQDACRNRKEAPGRMNVHRHCRCGKGRARGLFASVLEARRRVDCRRNCMRRESTAARGSPALRLLAAPSCRVSPAADHAAMPCPSPTIDAASRTDRARRDEGSTDAARSSRCDATASSGGA